MTSDMVTGPKRIWVLAVSAVVTCAGLGVLATAGGAEDAPVQAGLATAGTDHDTARPATRTAGDDAPSDGPSTTTTTAPPTTTSTTAAPATTAPAPAPVAPTAAPARPTPPATAPPTTAAPAPPPPPAPEPAPAGPVNGTRSGTCERFMADQINAARARVGQPGLAFDTGIQYIALSWSDGMSGRQVLSHNPSFADQILRHRDYYTAGENVGRGYDLATLFQAFMDSPAHRANIEQPAYSHLTVGCLTDGGGQYWVTQNFWG